MVLLNSSTSPNDNTEAPTTSKESPQLETLTTLVKQLAQNQEAVVSQFGNFKNSINEKLEQAVMPPVTPPKIEKSDSEDWWAGFEPDSKRAVLSEISKSTKDLESKFNERLKTETTKIQQSQKAEGKLKDEQLKFDNKAFKQFPQLNETGHPLTEETLKVIAEKKVENDNWESTPTFLYDSVRLAYSNLVMKGEIIPGSFEDEARRLISVHDGELPSMKRTIPQKVEELSQQQQLMADKLGVPHDKYLKQLKEHYSGPRYTGI